MSLFITSLLSLTGSSYSSSSSSDFDEGYGDEIGVEGVEGLEGVDCEGGTVGHTVGAPAASTKKYKK